MINEINDQSVDQLISMLYDAPLIDGGWNRAFADISSALNHSSILFGSQSTRFVDPDPIEVSMLVDPCDLQKFSELLMDDVANPHGRHEANKEEKTSKRVFLPIIVREATSMLPTSTKRG